MELSYFVHNKFSNKLVSDWKLLEKNALTNPFNSCYFHLGIYNIYVSSKKRNYFPKIICIYQDKLIKAILPFERFNSSNTLVIHGSEFIDYEGIIYSKDINFDLISEYISKKIISKYDIFIHSYEQDNRFINTIYNNSKFKFRWKYSIRYFVDLNSYKEFFNKKKKFIKKIERNIAKNNLIVENILSPENKINYLNKHITFKTIQYDLTNTRNPFNNKRYKKLLEWLILNYQEKIEVYTLFWNKNIQAVLISFKTKDKFCYYQPSYFRESKIESPGKILMYQALKKANEYNSEFDFSTGDELYKKLYSNRKIFIKSAYLSNRLIPNIFNLLLFWLLFYRFNRNNLRKVVHLAKKLFKFN